MEIKDFSEIQETFRERVESMVWCSMATIDSRGRPRSRIMHPIWEGATGWICTRRTSLKNKHLLLNKYVSLAYISDITKLVYVDCQAQWADDLADKQRIWDQFKNTPAPVGYDPGPIFIRPDHEAFGVLKLIPWRIAIVTDPTRPHEEGEQIWRMKALR